MSTPGQVAELHRVALRLHASQAARFGPGYNRLAPIWFVTDPARVSDPVAVAERLPQGCGVIYRAFGDPDAVKLGRELSAVARRRGLVLLVGADTRLARAVGAAGTHLPERMLHRVPAIRSAWPDALVTAAAHSRGAVLQGARLGLSAMLLSPVFASGSPSAGQPLGRLAFASIARASAIPVCALGGVDADTAPQLIGSGAAGLAAVSAFAA